MIIKRNDVFLIAFLLALAFLIYLPRLLDDSSPRAHIYINGREFKTVSIDKINKEQNIIIPAEPPVTLRAGPGYICFFNAGCPDKICVRAGRLTKKGDAAACVPARVVVVIRSSEPSEIDAIAG